jgi:hypothetical protein
MAVSVLKSANGPNMAWLVDGKGSYGRVLRMGFDHSNCPPNR